LFQRTIGVCMCVCVCVCACLVPRLLLAHLSSSSPLVVAMAPDMHGGMTYCDYHGDKAGGAASLALARV